jgi:hypothetical protein
VVWQHVLIEWQEWGKQQQGKQVGCAHRRGAGLAVASPVTAACAVGPTGCCKWCGSFRCSTCIKGVTRGRKHRQV